MKQKVVVLNGPPRCGKDTLLRQFPQITGNLVDDLRFSRPLKIGGHLTMGLVSATMEGYDATKDEPNPDFFDLTPREFYIAMSENFLKPTFGKDILGKLWLREYLRRHNELMTETFTALNHSMFDRTTVLCDLGFPDELEPLKDYFGASNIVILRLHREHKDFTGDSRNYIHNTGCKEYDVENPEHDVQRFYMNASMALADAGVI